MLVKLFGLSFKRNSLYESKLTVKILTLIGFGYVLLNFLFIGFFLDKILIRIQTNNSAIDTFCRFFIYLFVIDIILKFFIKSNKYTDILPYLTLPIKQNKIFALLFIKEILSKWNFLWVVILTPFFFKTFYPSHNIFTTFLLITTFYVTSLIISFLIRYINILSSQKSFLYIYLSIILAVGVGYLAYYISTASVLLIDISIIFTQYSLWILIGIIIVFLLLFAIFLKSCKYELYFQLTGYKKSATFFQFNIFNTLGVNGEIINMCLKEISRSQIKRSIFSAILMIIVSFLNLNNNIFFYKLFFSILPSMILYNSIGGYSFSSESTFFDKLMVLPHKTPLLIIIYKYILNTVFILSFITIFYLLNRNRISILYWISIYFFQIGVLPFCIYQNVVYNKERFDILGPLRKLFETNIINMITQILFFIIIGFVVIIAWLTSETTACYFMLITGVGFTLFSPLWLKNIYNRFLKRKYQNMNQFRNV